MNTPSNNCASDDDQPLTLGQLNAILVDFKASLERALARRDADFEERFGTGFGVIEPVNDPNEVVRFSASKQGSVTDRYKNQHTIKSTVQIPEKLHTALKKYGIEGSEPGESGPGLKLQTQLVIAIEEYLAKRGL